MLGDKRRKDVASKPRENSGTADSKYKKLFGNPQIFFNFVVFLRDKLYYWTERKSKMAILLACCSITDHIQMKGRKIYGLNNNHLLLLLLLILFIHNL